MPDDIPFHRPDYTSIPDLARTADVEERLENRRRDRENELIDKIVELTATVERLKQGTNRTYVRYITDLDAATDACHNLMYHKLSFSFYSNGLEQEPIYCIAVTEDQAEKILDETLR